MRRSLGTVILALALVACGDGQTASSRALGEVKTQQSGAVPVGASESINLCDCTLQEVAHFSDALVVATVAGVEQPRTHGRQYRYRKLTLRVEDVIAGEGFVKGQVVTTSQLSNDDGTDPAAWFSGNERIAVFLRATSGDLSAGLIAVFGLNNSGRLTKVGRAWLTPDATDAVIGKSAAELAASARTDIGGYKVDLAHQDTTMTTAPGRVGVPSTYLSTTVSASSAVPRTVDATGPKAREVPPTTARR